MRKLITIIITYCLTGWATASAAFVTADLMGQLGNQLFIISAATSLALDNGAEAIFPDLKTLKEFNVPANYQYVFSRLKVDLAEPIENYYQEKNFSYDPIPYAPNLKIRGWFQSEKYFRHNRNAIIKRFCPSLEIRAYLNEKYGFILEHPQTVSIHYRAYQKENPYYATVYADCGLEYYQKAISLFPADTLFVVFSDNIPWCKEMFKDLSYQFYYVEGNKHYHDLYLMSFCRHNIICNSSFSWWGAYLNRNPEKKVVAPFQWFHPSYTTDTKDMIPEEWTIL